MGEIQPQPGPQHDFIRTRADIAIYGGAAGGGKTFALLLEPTRHVHRRGFGAVIFRRLSPQITNEGGLWDESSEIYPWIGGRPFVGYLEWRFPPHGATVSFHHLQHESDKYNWQGSQIAFLGFDELSHFTEGQFWYMLSRNRSTCGIRPYVRATTNPDPGWVRDLLAPWVVEDFRGLRAVSGELRWFVREGGETVWVPEGTPDAKSITFIRASVYDNRILLNRNPEYLANLKAQSPVERARLLDGDWNVRREGLVYPGFDQWIAERAPVQLSGQQIGGVDFGFNNPFCAIWGTVDHDDVLWLIGCRYVRQCTIPTHAEAIPRGIPFWCDPAQPESIAQLRAYGHEAYPCRHRPGRGASGEKRNPKLAGIDMVSERMRTGRLRIVRGECLPLIRELGLYHYDPEKQSEEPVDEDNHACDAIRYLCVSLDRNRSRWQDPEDTDEARAARELRESQAEDLRRETEEQRARQDPFYCLRGRTPS